LVPALKSACVVWIQETFVCDAVPVTLTEFVKRTEASGGEVMVMVGAAMDNKPSFENKRTATRPIMIIREYQWLIVNPANALACGNIKLTDRRIWS